MSSRGHIPWSLCRTGAHGVGVASDVTPRKGTNARAWAKWPGEAKSFVGEGLLRLPGRALFPDAGWTLSELLISLAVMGILAALAVPSYLQQQRETRRSEARAALQQLQLEQASHRNAHGQYAASLSELGHAPSTSASGLYQLAITTADYPLPALLLTAAARPH